VTFRGPAGSTTSPENVAVSADPLAKIDVTIEVAKRHWVKWKPPIVGQAGFFYSIRIHTRQSRKFNCKHYLERTQSVHKHIVYICLDSHFDSVSFTLPAVLGEAELKRIIKLMIDEAVTCCLGSSVWGQGPKNTAESLAETWPEYVLGPENPLSFLGPDMPCKFFSA